MEGCSQVDIERVLDTTTFTNTQKQTARDILATNPSPLQVHKEVQNHINKFKRAQTTYIAAQQTKNRQSHSQKYYTDPKAIHRMVKDRPLVDTPQYAQDPRTKTTYTNKEDCSLCFTG